MNLEEFTFYFIVILFLVYFGLNYFHVEPFTDPPSVIVRDWRKRREELQNDDIYDYLFENRNGDEDNPLVLHSKNLISMYRLDEDVSSFEIQPLISDEEFRNEWRISRWRRRRNLFLEMLDDLMGDIDRGNAAQERQNNGENSETINEQIYAGKRAQEFIEIYQLDDDQTDARLIEPSVSDDIATENSDVQPVHPSPMNQSYLDLYVQPLKGAGCRMVPWGKELCEKEVRSVTLNDIDTKIKELTRAIENDERDMDIRNSNVNIVIDDNDRSVISLRTSLSPTTTAPIS